MKSIIKRNPLFFAFLIPALTDGVVTILGQSNEYWSQNRTVNEASPAYYFLLASPWLYILGAFFWFVIWYLVFKRLKEPFNLWLMFLFMAGHSWGSSSWIMRMLRESGFYAVGNQVSVMVAWSVLILYFALIAFVATYCLRIYIKDRKSL